MNNPVPLGLAPSFGFGDRLGLATPGHIAAAQGRGLAPIFAQQSVRENARTGRTPLQVLEDARRAVDAAGWEAPWGADADHLKTLDDLPPFVDAGYTFFTVDPGAFVDNAADDDDLAVLQRKVHLLGWEELSALYLDRDTGIPGLDALQRASLLRAAAKYVLAIRQVAEMYGRLAQMKADFDFEVSVDETETPTTPLEHYFLASELTRRGVRFNSLAPRFIGRFEKGVDYIGDLAALDAEMAKHAAVSAHFGTYKLSLHSGSDKFSVYPLLAKHWGRHFHVKTAGTSYLEALRTLAGVNPGLFERIWGLARERYPVESASYHVSAQLSKVSPAAQHADLLDDFHARQILHVTFGSALVQFGAEIRASLQENRDRYYADLERHFARHLDLLGS